MDELFRTLDIKLPLSSEDLQTLIHWCEHTISTDRQSTEDLEKRAAFYEHLASLFLEQIQPYINREDLTAPIATFDGMSSLQCIVNNGFDVYLKSLTPTPEQINTAHNGISLLVYAAAAGRLHTTEALLSLRASPTDKPTHRVPLLFTVLMLPIAHDAQMVENKQQLYRLLSPFYPNLLQEKDESGDTVLHNMSVHGYTQLIQEVLSRPDMKELPFISNNFIHYPIHTAILNGQYDCVKLLIQVEGVGDLKDAKGRTPLHYAAQYGDQEMVGFCIPYGDKNAADIQGQTPLIRASIADNDLALTALLASGVDINATDNEHKTALHHAVESNHLRIVSQLLKQEGIHLNVADANAHNPLDLVKMNTPNGNEIRRLLIEHGALPGSPMKLNP